MGRPRKVVQKGGGTRAVVYLRVSKEDGATKHGLDDQRAACWRYVHEQVYGVVGELVDDGVSGARRWQDRSGLTQAVNLCVAGQADVIVAYHQDRFARKMGVFDDLRDVAVLKGFRLETSDHRVLTRPDDFITGDVQALVAAIERRRISERFHAARRRRSAQDGRGSGPLPYGYCLGQQRQLLVDTGAVPVLRKLFAWRRRGLTYQETANHLNAAGYHAPRGGQWAAANVFAVERHKELYKTGRRIWDGIESAERWPVILGRQGEVYEFEASSSRALATA